METVDQAKTKMSAALEHLGREMKNLRTSRANPGMIDGILVDVYGTHMKLHDIATITVPEPRQLLISPFDVNNAPLIRKAIEKANLGLQCILEANVIRINIPPMDENLRKEVVKQAKKKCEDAKIIIRNIRAEANKRAKDQKAKGDLTEDLLKRAEKEIQTLTDKSCKQMDEMTVAKEKEILTV